jgi:transaldolase
MGVNKMKKLNIKIYSDGANVDKMIQDNLSGKVHGFTTNPTLMVKDGVKNYIEFAKDVLSKITDKSISFEVFSDDIKEMYSQALKINELGSNVYVKIPVSNTKKEYTYELIKKLSDQGVKLNVTALFTIDHIDNVFESLNKETPSIISIFAGRIANAGIDPEPTMKYASNLTKDHQNIEILWASSREVFNVIQAERCGCDIITMTPSLIKGMDDIGMDLDEYSLDTVKMFYKDATEAGFSID